MRLVGAVAALLRRVRAERGTTALVFVLVALTGFVVAAAPRLFDRVSDDGLRFELTRGTAIQRNLEFTTVDPLPAGGAGDPLAPVAARAVLFRDGLAPSVRDLIDDIHFIVDSPRFRVIGAPLLPTFVTLREADGIDGQVDLVAGRWPARVSRGAAPDPSAPPAIEIALSDTAAARVGLAVGDQLDARVDATDPLLRGVPVTSDTAIRIDLVGTFTVRDPSASVWFDDRGLAEVTIGGTADAPLAFATGLIAPAAYPDLLALGQRSRYRWRLFTDPARVDAGGLDALTSDLRQLQLQYGATGERPGAIVLRTGILAGIQRYTAQHATTETVLGLTALGPIVVAAGAVGLVGILVVRRRRASLALARGRGASGAQLMATQLWEGLLVTVPAALLGLGVAIVVIPARPSDLSSIGAILVALGATAILLAATWPVARRARRDLERDDPPVVRMTARRLVFEALVVGLSLTAAWLLRERGLGGVEPSGATRTPAPFDPFLAATPVLIGIAVAVLTIRLYPIPVRGLGWLLARRRGLVPVLGLRSLGRQPSSGSLPVLVLLVTLAIGTFSSVLLASLEGGQVAAAMQEVGADFRISAGAGGTLDPGLAAGPGPSSLPGVVAVAGGTIVSDASLSTDPRALTTVYALAVDAAAYDRVLAGMPGVPALAPWVSDAPLGPDAGTAAHPIPAVVSTRLPGLGIGTPFQLVLRGRRMDFRVAARIDGFPGIGGSTPFVITTFGSVAAGWQGSPLKPTVLFARGPATLVDGLRMPTGNDPAPVVVSRYERYALLHATPLVGAVSGGFAIALGLASAYAGLAVMSVVVLHAQRRAREAAFLRTLGVTGRQLVGLTVIEQGLPLVVALAIGIALGLGLASLLEPGIDLGAFSGPGSTVALMIDPISIAAVAASISVVVVVAIGTSSWLARRLDIGRALRIGED